jgi:excisionase family DNA binding protein
MKPLDNTSRITLNLPEVAERLGVSLSHVKHLVNNGVLHSTTLPGRSGTRGRRVVRIADVDALLAPPAEKGRAA